MGSAPPVGSGATHRVAAMQGTAPAQRPEDRRRPLNRRRPRPYGIAEAYGRRQPPMDGRRPCNRRSRCNRRGACDRRSPRDRNWDPHTLRPSDRNSPRGRCRPWGRRRPWDRRSPWECRTPTSRHSNGSCLGWGYAAPENSWCFPVLRLMGPSFRACVLQFRNVSVCLVAPPAERGLASACVEHVFASPAASHGSIFQFFADRVELEGLRYVFRR